MGLLSYLYRILLSLVVSLPKSTIPYTSVSDGFAVPTVPCTLMGLLSYLYPILVSLMGMCSYQKVPCPILLSGGFAVSTACTLMDSLSLPYLIVIIILVSDGFAVSIAPYVAVWWGAVAVPTLSLFSQASPHTLSWEGS